MKKDKEKPLSAPLPTDAGTTTSSIALALQKMNKETEKKEAAAEAAKVRCKTCFREIFPVRRCGGHGGGGGGDSSSSEAEAIDDADDLLTDQIKNTRTKVEDAEQFYASDENAEFELSSKDLFDPKVIAELIENGQLLVDNDRESKTLSIKLLCEPDSLSLKQRQELKKFMKAIIKEFEEFKKENNLSNECLQYVEDKDGNILSIRITLPTLALYDAFIQRLANNLVPMPSPSPKKEESVKEQTSTLNPAETIENPEEDNKQQETFNPSPLSTQMKFK